MGLDPSLGPSHSGPAADTGAGASEQVADASVELARRLEATRGQLLQSERMASIGLIAAGVAHEINNPIGFVSSNLGTLKYYVGNLLELLAAYEAEEASLSENARARLQALKERADLAFLRDDIVDLVKESRDGLDRVTRIVQDLKEFSRRDDGEWVEADLNMCLESTLNVASNEIKYKAQVVRELADLPPVRCRPAQLGQVFMNLLVNAAHAIDGSGTITVRSGAGVGRVWVEVEDTGKGMTPEVQAHIFEPFFTTKPSGQGTGLGLSIAHDIVRGHQGGIEVGSVPGAGTRIRVWVPLGEGAPEVRDEGAKAG